MEEASELRPLSTQDSRNLSELHDAYRTFCEYGWHHLTWKNLAYTLATYLSVDFKQNAHGQLLHSRPDPRRIQYLTDLNVETFGYLTKDALWVLFRHTGFGNDYELNLGDHRPFQTPAWQYLLLLPHHDLRILIVDVANILRDRTTTSHASANILSLTPDWRPTFGAEYGIFRYFEVQLSPNDAASLGYLQLERQAALQPLPLARSKNFLRRALSVRSLPNRDRTQSAGLVDGEFQPRTRFSWPLTEKYRRLFPRRRSVETSTQSSNVTIRPNQSQRTALAEDVSQTESIGSPGSSATLTPTMFQRRIVDDTLQEEDSSDAESIKSTNTMESLLDFYVQGFQDPKFRNEEFGRPDDAAKESPIADSPTLAPMRPPIMPVLSALDTSVDTDLDNERPISPTSGHQSFVTAKTVPSERTASRTASRLTQRSSRESFFSLESMFSDPPILPVSSEYYRLLGDQNLLPEPAAETDWSGRGQHAEFSLTERHLIPLQAEKVLGRTRTAIVESVRCKRVRLVRKTIKCTEWTGVKREDALREVQHLYRAQHAHIVRLVGSYAIGPDLAILTYPCAQWDLEQFMGFARTAHESTAGCASALRQFFTCTAKVVDFLHSFPIKHMDIKPQNLLVREIPTPEAEEMHQYKLYFTDFGISKAYESVDECDTESPTSFTRTYAAQEVVIQESRGLSADMFSLGCVYSEMLAAILDASIVAFEPHGEAIEIHWAALRAARHTSESGLRPYHHATEDVRAWLYQLPIEREMEMLAVRDWTVTLLSNEAGTRPTARQIADDSRLPFACRSCNLRRGQEDFEAAEPLALTPRQESPHRWGNPARELMEVPALA
ncbi:kinase-like protein [Karstenula rhodostoma CBS 690.94]|uniref:Kinase-like protein n=1 Tax=Karstenula rhodostoma CBS 690.94 TaxID=1392251 RepID=A0A9P4PA50_9PLEO|nr:kinase-like protein [Karstenula rhodostoma CBS 690.94]